LSCRDLPDVELNPPGQYADGRNLAARQRLWRCQVPLFGLAAWVLDLAGVAPGMRVLDAGCALAIAELRRVLAPGGTCVVVTTGAGHLRSLRALVERAARVSTPGWRMAAPTGDAFTTGNAAAQLGAAFPDVTCVRPETAGPVIIRDASVAADYVSSLAGHYQAQVSRPWPGIAGDVRDQVQAVIGTDGEFRTAGDLAAFVCRQGRR
jgi:hypothetical protein